MGPFHSCTEFLALHVFAAMKFTRITFFVALIALGAATAAPAPREADHEVPPPDVTPQADWGTGPDNGAW